jgi:hypothetical protein
VRDERVHVDVIGQHSTAFFSILQHSTPRVDVLLLYPKASGAIGRSGLGGDWDGRRPTVLQEEAAEVVVCPQLVTARLEARACLSGFAGVATYRR